MFLRQSKVSSVMLLLWFFCIEPSSASASFSNNIQHWETTQGTKVYFYPTKHSPVVHVRLIFNAGNAHGKTNATSFLVASLYQYGTKKESYKSFISNLNFNGATLQTLSYDGLSTFTLSTNLFETQLANSLEMLRDLLINPRFNEKELLEYRDNQKNSLDSQFSIPSGKYSRGLVEAIFPNHPFGKFISPQDMENTKRSDVMDFYHQYYVTNNATLLLVGDLTQAEAKKISEELLVGLPKGKPTPPISLFKPQDKPGEHIFIKDASVQQTSIQFGEVGMVSSDPDLLAVSLGMAVLSGDSLKSRIPDAMRNQHGFSYSSSCMMTDLPQHGVFSCSTAVANKHAAEALTVMVTTLKEFLRDGPTEEEVNRVKKNLRLSFESLSSNGNILDIMTAMAQGERSWTYLDDYLQKLASITPQQIKLAMQKHIKLENLIFVILGPKDIRDVLTPELLRLDLKK